MLNEPPGPMLAGLSEGIRSVLKPGIGIDDEKFRWIGNLAKEIPVFFLEYPFKVAKVAGFGNATFFQGYGLNKVVPHVHHEVHRSGFDCITE